MAAGTADRAVRMTLRRMIMLFVAALTVMLSIVVLRAETVRVQHEIAQLDRQEDVLRQELERERAALEQALQPAALLERIKQLRVSELEPAPAPAARPARP